jgi:hypothetical protein
VSSRLDQIIEQARATMGPFFVARLTLRVNFSLGGAPDTDENVKKLIEACRALGFNPTATPSR